MGDGHSNGGSGDTPEALAAEREEMEEAVAGLRQMERDFETLTEQAKMFDPDLVAFCVKLKGSEMKRCIWKGFFTPEGFQWHKPAMAMEKALLDQLLQDLAAYCEALVRWAEELEEREQAYRSKAVQQSVREPIENVEPAENPVEEVAGWIWNQGGIKATAGIITDAVADVGSGTIYGLSRASDYATNLLSFNDPLEVLTQDVPMSETSEAAAKEMDPEAKAGWYNPSEPGNNAAKTLLNVGSMLFDPENAGNVVSNEVRVNAVGGDEALILKPYNEAEKQVIQIKNADNIGRFSRVGGPTGDFLFPGEETLQEGLRDPTLYKVRLTTMPIFSPFLETLGRVTGRGLNTAVEIGPAAFSSRQNLIETIIHEETHIRLDLRSIRGSLKATKIQSELDTEEFYVESVAQRFWRMYGKR